MQLKRLAIFWYLVLTTGLIIELHPTMEHFWMFALFFFPNFVILTLLLVVIFLHGMRAGKRK